MAAADTRPVVLVAEDNALIGLDLRDALEDAGYRVAGPFRKSRDAVIAVQQDPPDLAVLDVMLFDGSCDDLARELRREAIPFLVYSGRPRDEAAALALAGAPWFDKPASIDAIVAGLAAFDRPALPAQRVRAIRRRYSASASP